MSNFIQDAVNFFIFLGGFISTIIICKLFVDFINGK